MTRAEQTEKELKAQGWEYDHSAMVKGYHYAGTTEDMRSKDGYDFCRIYDSECHMGNGGFTFQVSWVFKRER